jgi:hypothetical protein
MAQRIDPRIERSMMATGVPDLSTLRSELQLGPLIAPGSGASRVITIIPETDFQFDGRNAGGVEQLVVLAERLDVTHFSTASLIVRYHTKGADGTWSSGTCSAEVRAFNMSTAREEPHSLFVESTARATVQIANAHTAPRLYVASLGAPIAAELRIVLAWIQGTTASSPSEKLSLAVSIVGRE